MTIRRQARVLLTLSAVLAAWCVTSAQAPVAPQAGGPASLEQAIPLDPAVRMGTFPNGLRYYIRANKKPENRAELRLVVNAGSLVEDDDQPGQAVPHPVLGFAACRSPADR